MTRVKSVRSERGQGGSVVVNADKLSRQKPLAALYPNLHRKCGVTGRYFLPSSLLVSLCTHLLSQSILPAIDSLLFFLYDLAFCSHFFPFMFLYLTPFLSFPFLSFPFLSFPFLSSPFFTSMLLVSHLSLWSFFNLNLGCRKALTCPALFCWAPLLWSPSSSLSNMMKVELGEKQECRRPLDYVLIYQKTPALLQHWTLTHTDTDTNLL